MDKITHSIGLPLLQCSPFAQVILSNQRGHYCDYCFQKILQPIRCPNCTDFHYCSQSCLKNDFNIHRDECKIKLINKVTHQFPENFYSNLLYQTIYNDFHCVNDYFSPQDLVDYTLLFFRVLKRSRSVETEEILETLEDKIRQTSKKPKFGPYNASIANLKRRVSWKDLSVSVNWNRKTKKSRSLKSEELLGHYIDRFDSLSEEEAMEFDKLLDLEMPSNESFAEMVLENDVKYVLSEMVESVVNQITNEYINWNYGLIKDNLSDSQSSHSVENIDHKESQISASDLCKLFDQDLRSKKIWEHLSNMHYDQAMKYVSNMFQMFKKHHGFSDESVNFEDSQRLFDKNLDKELQKQSVFYDRLPDDINYVSKHLNYNSAFINQNENDSIATLKMNYRLNHLQGLLKNTSTYDNEIEYYFGFWLNGIMRILSQPEVLRVFGTIDFNEVQKVFFITIRYAIAVTDVLCVLPIARAIYLPLSQFEHSCFANTSIVFEGNYLKLFYLPDKKLPITYSDALSDLGSSSKKQTDFKVPYIFQINTNDIKINFQYEITTKSDSITIYVSNKLRFLNCLCGRCQQTKGNVGLQDLELFNEICDESSNMEDCNDLDENYLYEGYNYFQSDLSQHYLSHTQNDFSDDHKEFDYDYEFGKLSRANLLYGNRLDLEYSVKIHELIIELLDSFRVLLGYYHPQITIMLLLINYCNFTIIKSCPDRVEIFYCYKYAHKFIVELLDSLVITHGVDHFWISKIESLHQFCHQSLELLFSNEKERILQMEQKVALESSSSGSCKPYTVIDQRLLSFDHCRELYSLNTHCSLTDKDIINLKKYETMQNEDYHYNPYLSFKDSYANHSMEVDSDLYALMDMDGEKTSCNINFAFQILAEISDFFSYRFL